MRITLTICLFFATHLHAGVIRDNDIITSNSSNIVLTTSVPYFAADKLLEKISASCIGLSELKSLGGDTMGLLEVANKYKFPCLIDTVVSTIARSEFRAALNFKPLSQWGPYNQTKEEELTSSNTLEAYYDSKESRSPMDLFNSLILVEENIHPALQILDKMYPSIRILFRRKIQEILRSNQGKINRGEIDRWIDELLQIRPRISEAFSKSFNNVDLRTFECTKQRKTIKYIV